MDWHVWVTVAVVVASLALLVVLLRLPKGREEEQDLEERLEPYRGGPILNTGAIEPYYGPLRYEIEVSDWGPDFDGVHTLARYRWCVWNADRVRIVVDRDETRDLPVVGVDVPFMLGNEPTRREATIAALSWIEEQKFPLRVVVS